MLKDQAVNVAGEIVAFANGKNIAKLSIVAVSLFLKTYTTVTANMTRKVFHGSRHRPSRIESTMHATV
jgi:hypothetical protein